MLNCCYQWAIFCFFLHVGVDIYGIVHRYCINNGLFHGEIFIYVEIAILD